MISASWVLDQRFLFVAIPPVIIGGRGRVVVVLESIREAAIRRTSGKGIAR
ncbi:MAG: hypothetical protein MZV65_32510 [Chromatiales bacterium]|nr:hypothetical protein [Chromatiales bacterium]